MIKVKCKTCDKYFETRQCWIKRGRGKYCSKICSNKRIHDTSSAVSVLKEMIKNGFKVGRPSTKIYSPCVICKKDILCHKSSVRKTCSNECLSAHVKTYPKRIFKHSEESKKKMSEIRKKLPKVGFIANPKKGSDNWRWRGGVSSEHEKIRKSKEYADWRTSVFVRDNYTCVLCKKGSNKLNADHIKPFSLYPELRLSIDNGRTLCEKCHRETDTYGFKFYNLNIKKYNKKTNQN